MGWQNGCCAAPTVVRRTARRRTSPIGQPYPADPRWLRKRLQRPDRSRCASRSGYRGAPARDHGCWLPSRDGLGFARRRMNLDRAEAGRRKKHALGPARHASEGRCGWTIASRRRRLTALGDGDAGEHASEIARRKSFENSVADSTVRFDPLHAGREGGALMRPT